MVIKRTRLLHLRNGESLDSQAKTGISLHCHTHHSKENLDFLPHYADRVPIIAFFWRREYEAYKKREQRDINFDTAYWAPPLSPELVYAGEKDQINAAGLNAIVSVTDHDTIEGNLAINKIEASPISMEWTVPFEHGFFHIGVHNLPKADAESITATLLEYTYDPTLHSTQKLNELFQFLDELPGVLVVLNHPIWDIEMIGDVEHGRLLTEFLKRHGQWIHALEVNGFRRWSENKAVIELAESIGKPVTAGGDRHGCRPNTVINISDCSTMEEYADELRTDRRNQVALMPQYERPICSRQLESFAEILREYDDLPADRRRWMQRMFFDTGEGHGLRSIREIGMIDGPIWLRAAIRTLGVLGSPNLALLFRFVRRRADRVPQKFDNFKFEPSKTEDVSGKLSSEPVV